MAAAVAVDSNTVITFQTLGTINFFSSESLR
jgi:hypothetical protein